MAIEVELRHIEKAYGSFRASDDVSLTVERGRLVGLLGPSGGGKTTILRLIAGLESPDAGDIFLGGQRMNGVAPGKRGIGFVFQDYALFRHMTVRENIAFGLKIQKVPIGEQEKRVSALIDLIGLTGLGDRYPLQLSGGQRQRVAFARALAPSPRLLLLDEPFAAIDAKVRKELRGWLRQTIHRLGITSIFVTHDQDEAVEVADDIIIMQHGHVEQAGTPLAIYQSPRTPFVADFVGTSVHVPDYTVFKGFGDGGGASGGEGIIRPEFLEIGADAAEMRLPLASEDGIVRGVYFRGDCLQVDVEVKGQLLRGRRSLEKRPLHEGDVAKVFIHRIYTFADGGTRILENAAKREEPVVI